MAFGFKRTATLCLLGAVALQAAGSLQAGSLASPSAGPLQARLQPAHGGRDQIPVDRLIIKFKPAAQAVVQRSLQPSAQIRESIPALQRLASRHQLQGRPLRRLPNGSHVVQLDQQRSPADIAAVISQFILDPDIEMVEVDLRMFPAAIPTDPLYVSQWALSEATGGVRPQAAWDFTQGQGAVVAILDTGVLPHADLVGNLLPGYDFVSNTFMANDGGGRDSDASDPGDAIAADDCGSGVPEQDEPSSWHGTHVAGIAAAQAFNGVGGSGVAFQAEILPVRVLGRCGGYTSDIVDAIYWAAGFSVSGVPANASPADVINLSLSSPVAAACSASYSDAINAARGAGTLVVVAAGNAAGNADTFPPGNCPGAFTVAATTRQGGRAFYSNYGSLVDLAAPGGAMQSSTDPNGILSTANSGTQAPVADNYIYLQGSSMAAPQVTGVAALLFAADDTLTVDAAETAMRTSARAFPASCVGCGAGLVDASAAMALVTGTVTPADAADLALTLKGTTGKFVKDAANPGQGTIQYQADIANNGPDIATAVVLANVFPDAVVLETITPGQGSCNSAGTTCTIGDLVAGATASVVVKVRTTNSASMPFQGQVTAATADPVSANNYVLKKFGGALGWLVLPLLGLLWRRRNTGLRFWRRMEKK
ncbi:MAG: S8 family serine peptidase [Pseudomonadota bacterium]